MAQGENTTNFTEQAVDSAEGFKVNGEEVINSSGEVIAPISQTGSNTLGDAASDVQTLNGVFLTPITTASSGAGAVAITGSIHEITTTGADALTLADGTEGQRLSVVMVSDGGDGTLTPSNFANGSTMTFDNNDTAELLFTAGAWYFMGGTAAIA